MMMVEKAVCREVHAFLRTRGLVESCLLNGQFYHDAIADI
jgi:hypothetical protein